MMSANTEFPVDGVLPKRSTQALSFIEQNPTYDGRQVLVAILDTGVDPGAKGLQRTPDGAKKMVGLLDPSGGGDVCTSKVVKTAKSDTDYLMVGGLSGRNLKIDANVDNPSGEWHIGIKCENELFPSGLVRRLKEERKRKWTARNSECLVRARIELEKWDKVNDHTKTEKKTSLPRAKLLERNELALRVTQLEELENSYEDTSPVFDCLVFQGSDKVWRALVDTQGQGDLRGRRALRSFAAYDDDPDGYEFDKWDDTSQLNFAVNIFEDGNLLSIVDSGSHGTHVASIVGGYHPEQPDLNGVAPGAKLISMKIGDGRLDGMETATSIIRAFNMCAALGVDVINMSFGEPTSTPDMGRVADLAKELSEKHGVVLVSSAGNSGPALSTVGAPGATSDSLIGVGAWVEPSMMLAAYSMKPGCTPPANSYTWSSRGPSYDGGMGVTVTAPGAAIAAVPEWTLQQKRLMNGTSMSSPNVAGCVALILSGLKQRGVKYMPCMISRGLQASAMYLPDVEVHAQGAGLIQVAKAFELLVQPTPGVHFQIPYRISVSSEARTNAKPGTGIYIREPWETASGGVREYDVTVTPKFPIQDANVNVSPSHIRYTNAVQNEMEVYLDLKCTQPWVTVPPHLMMHSGSKGLKVAVDTSMVPDSSSGSKDVAYCEIQAFDRSCNNWPIWTIPVTVIKPETCEGPKPCKKYAMTFTPGHLVRHFIAVPVGATVMDIILTPDLTRPSSIPEGSSRTFFITCMQMGQQSNYRDDWMYGRLPLRQEAGAATSRSMAVSGESTVEVCISQFWSSLGSGSINVEIHFNGVVPTPSDIYVAPNDGGYAQVNLRANIGVIPVEPNAKLNTWVKTIRPTGHKSHITLQPSGARDAILGADPPERRPTYGLLLSYSFKQLEAGKLTPRFPLLDRLLYDSPYDSQMCMLFNQDKKLLSCTDAWPEPVKVPKGDITARVFVRHEKRQLLERLLSMPMVLERKLSSPVNLTSHKTLAGACTGGSSFGTKMLSSGEECTLFLAVPLWKDMSKKLPKGISTGDILCGTVTYGKRNSKDAAVVGTNKRPGGYNISVSVIAPPQSPAEDPTLADSTEQDTAEAEGQKSSDKEEKDPEQLEWDLAIAPQLKSLLKSLDDMKRRKGEQADEIFVAEVARMETLLGSKKATTNTKIKEALGDFKLELLMKILHRLVTKHKTLLQGVKKTETVSGKDAERKALVDAADDIISFINIDDLVNCLQKYKQSGDLDDVGESESQKESSKRASDKRQALVEALVVKLHACNFASEPETESMLLQFVESKDLSVIQLKMDRHYYNKRYASCLQLLPKLEDSSSNLSQLPIPLTKKELQEFKQEVFRGLEWDHLVQDIDNMLLTSFPAAYPVF